jgi:membrane-bound serine protease (ClpP class)
LWRIEMRKRLGWLILSLTILLAFVYPPARSQGEHVDLLVFSGPITPVFERYIERGITAAQKDGAEVLIIKMDTPGGSVDITHEIVQKILNSPVPVVVYVAPSGAHAASAGTFVTLAAHVAAMAPGTTIGAASPISNEGKDLEKTLKKKVTNVLAKDIRNLAERRGKKAADWAEKAVTEAQAATAREALDMGVIDFIADDVIDLMDKMDGMEVTVQGKKQVLHTKGLPIHKIPMSTLDAFLNAITSPTIAAILLTLGINGIIFELASPGAYLPGIIGAICLLLSFYALGALNANYTGLLFIALAFLLFIVDIKAPTHGVLTAGGIASFIFGSMVLFNTPYTTVPWATIIGLALATGAFFAFAIAAAVRTYRKRPVTGQEGLVGMIGEARSRLDPEGMVLVHGELWQAEAENPPVEKGEKVAVTKVQGLRIKVRKLPQVHLLINFPPTRKGERLSTSW